MGERAGKGERRKGMKGEEGSREDERREGEEGRWVYL
jgi:hypothetical protein